MAFSHDIADYPAGIVLAVDKPWRWTSADVIRKLKYAAIRHFRKKNLKVGHAGTLDPLATGLLLVCIGPATRRAEALQRSEKEYLAGIKNGIELCRPPVKFRPPSGCMKHYAKIQLELWINLVRIVFL